MNILETSLCHGGWRGNTVDSQVFSQTHFRSILRRVFNFELSSDLSDTYASGLEVVVSAVDVIEVARDGAGDALALFGVVSAEGGELMLTY